MNRSKLLGAVIAVLALASFAALPAAASAAAGFTAGKYPAAFVGGEAKLTVSLEGFGTEYCTAPKFEGLLEGPSRFLKPASTGNGSECGYGGPMKMNGCQFEFHRDTNTADIGPAGCGPIEVSTEPFCGYIKVFPKSGLTATYTNAGSGSEASVRVGLQAKGLKFQITQGGSSCHEGTFYNGEISTWTESPWVVRAYQAKTKTPPYVLGEQVGISTVSEPPSIGIFMDEKGLDAYEFPVGVTAASTEGETFNLMHGFTTAGVEKWSLRCTKATVDGASLSGPSAQQSLTAFSGCSVPGVAESASVTMNSCSYKLGSNVEIACTTSGDAIKIGVPFCTISLPAQVINKEGPTFTNHGEGSTSNVTFALTGAGEKDTASGFGCSISGIPASGENGTTSASLKMTGAYPW